MMVRRRWLHVPSPFDDELLSSWLRRVAVANRQTNHTFASTMWGTGVPWIRDVDRVLERGQFDVLSAWTGVTTGQLIQMDLRRYGQVLGGSARGRVPWVLALGRYHRLFRGHGSQYCAACLSEGATYVRRIWRLGFVTECVRHRVGLLDACPVCDAPFQFHRMDRDVQRRWRCTTCSADLVCSAQSVASKSIVLNLQDRLVRAAERGWTRMQGRWVHARHLTDGLHVLARMLWRSRNHMLFKVAIRRLALEGMRAPGREVERVRVAPRRILMGVLACWMREWPDAFLSDVRTSGVYRCHLVEGAAPFWVQEALDSLPGAQPHILTRQEVTVCREWLITHGVIPTFSQLVQWLELDAAGSRRPGNLQLLTHFSVKPKPSGRASVERRTVGAEAPRCSWEASEP
jgi:hypothetical protein